jgi:AmmeMemoRadiSam system protein B/AmmeMemoRadiSam system protein A
VYSLLKDASIKRVIILGPDHAGIVNGIALPSFARYHIPTGDLPIATTLIKQLAQQPHFHIDDTVFSTEHSVEMQLPLIHRFLNKALVIPLIVGKLSCTQAYEIACTLKSIMSKGTIVVISSDFVHYGARFNFTPFQDHQQLRIRGLDSQAIAYLQQEQCAPFEQFIASSHATICGANPLKIMLAMMELKAFGQVEPRLIAYATSTQDDTEDSVSYVGMLFTMQRLAAMPIDQQLTQQEQNNLYAYMLTTLNQLFYPVTNPELYTPILSFGIMQQHGAFVTLRTKTAIELQLRGCIGRITTDAPLYQTVAQVTQDAALHDPRFTPLTADELPYITTKLSVLSQPKKIKTYQQISLGSDGVILEYDNASALFLPEVPIEFHWSLPTMLTELARKAGLPANVIHKKGVIFKTFRTLDIG